MKTLIAVVCSTDSAKVWGVIWAAIGISVVAVKDWIGIAALVFGMAYTARKWWREEREEKEKAAKIPIVMLLLLALVPLTGCGLIPKRVEYFQRKVEAMPQKSASLVEAERQGAELAARLAWSAQVAAHAEQASTNVLNPLDGLAVVSRAVSASVGPPASKWTDEPSSLADRLDTRNARLDAKIEDYAASVQHDVGKKIEGTGWLKVPYLLNFAFWGCMVVAVVMVGRIALNLWNPAIGGVVGQVERVGIGVVKRGFSQVISGVESFKERVDSLDLDDKAKDAIKRLLSEKLIDNQDHDVQAAVKRLAN